MKIFSRDRIVVTGIGVVSPIGCDLDSFQHNLTAPTPPNHDGHPEFTGHINDFGPVSPQTKRVIRKSLKLMNRETQLGVAAAQKAIHASGILEAAYDSDRIGVCFGAGNVEIRQDDFVAGVDACRQSLGDFDPKTWGQFGIGHVDPLWLLRVLPNMPACHTAIANDFRGPNNTITQANVATNMAINEARHAILDGDADAMIVGGTGTGFLQDVSEASLPDNQPAEAAAGFVLEKLDAAIARGAPVIGEILAACSATVILHDHRANPQAAIRAVIVDALEQSQLDTNSIELISSNSIPLDFYGPIQALDRTPNRSISQRAGNAAAGSSALAVAASLLSLGHDQLDKPSAGTPEPSDTIAINVNAMENGLASCVVIGSVDNQAAA